MKTSKLTSKQENILIFIKKYIAKNDFPPTVREIAKAVNLSSPATVHVHLKNLIQKGYIRRSQKNHRILELLVPNEFIQVNNTELQIPLFDNNVENSTFNILKSSISKYNEVIAFKMDNNNFNNIGIYKDDILIFEIKNVSNSNDIILIKDKNNFKVIINTSGVDKSILIGKLVKLYREY